MQRLSIALLLGAMLGCGSAPTAVKSAPKSAKPLPAAPKLPWETANRWEVSSARRVEHKTVALVGGKVMTAAGKVWPVATVLMVDGKLKRIAAEVEIPEGATVVDVRGKVVTPGIIDTHSHMGVYPQPAVKAHSDGNEASSPVTAQIQAAHSFWPQDPALARALQAGVTTIQILPGSANLIGGQGDTLKMHLGRTVSDMVFDGAPKTLKMACGENPKRVYGGRKSAPSTRMGNVAGYRAAYQKAAEYGESFKTWQHTHRTWAGKKKAFEAKEEGAEDPGIAPAPPARDFGLETLYQVIQGKVLVQVHCYRADEMALMIQVAEEFGFKIRSFHHAVEAYKIRDILERHQVAVSTWTDWWGFKMEAYDAIPENLAMLTRQGVTAVLHSDSPNLIQRLNQEAAKAMTAGNTSGFPVSEDEALAWITKHPAWVLGIDDKTGTLEAGKMADVVVWSGSPFSTYSHVDQVYIDGQLKFDRKVGRFVTDFELGQESRSKRRDAIEVTP